MCRIFKQGHQNRDIKEENGCNMGVEIRQTLCKPWFHQFVAV